MGQIEIVEFLEKNKGVQYSAKSLYYEMRFKNEIKLPSFSSFLKSIRTLSKHNQISRKAVILRTNKGIDTLGMIYWKSIDEYEDIGDVFIERIPEEIKI